MNSFVLGVWDMPKRFWSGDIVSFGVPPHHLPGNLQRPRRNQLSRQETPNSVGESKRIIYFNIVDEYVHDDDDEDDDDDDDDDGDDDDDDMKRSLPL